MGHIVLDIYAIGYYYLDSSVIAIHANYAYHVFISQGHIGLIGDILLAF